jgi:hypothetical protein
MRRDKISAGNVPEQLHVGRILSYKEEQSLDRFNGFVAGKTATNDADLVKIFGREEEFLASRS